MEEHSPESLDDIGAMFKPVVADDDKRAKELKAVVNAIFDPTDMTQKGVLNNQQAFHLTRASIYADTYHSKTMGRLVSLLLQFSVSNKGRGRTDLKTLLQAIMHSDEDKEDTIRKRLLGG